MRVLFNKVICSFAALFMLFNGMPIENVKANTDNKFIEIVEESNYYKNNETIVLAEGKENSVNTEEGIKYTAVYEIDVEGTTKANLIFIGDENYKILNIYKVNYYEDRLSIIDLKEDVVSTMNSARGPVRECLEQVCASQAPVINYDSACRKIVGSSCPQIAGMPIIYLLCKASVAIACTDAEVGYMCVYTVDQFVACPL